MGDAKKKQVACVFFTVLCLAFDTSHAADSPPILSRIQFVEGSRPLIHFADVSQEDLLKDACPLSCPDYPVDAVDQFITKLRESISRIKAAQSGNCAALENQAKANQADLETALKNQLVAANPATAN